MTSDLERKRLAALTTQPMGMRHLPFKVDFNWWSSLISVYTLRHSFWTFWTHYYLVKPNCSNCRIIVAMFQESGCSCQHYLSRLTTKPTKWPVHPAKTQISLGTRPVWSVLAVGMKKHYVLSYPLSALQGLRSDSADAQADPSLCWAHRSFCWFCHVVAHFALVSTAPGPPVLVFFCLTSQDCSAISVSEPISDFSFCVSLTNISCMPLNYYGAVLVSSSEGELCHHKNKSQNQNFHPDWSLYLVSP